MELYKINLDNDTQPITECECSTLSKLQLLNTKNTCIFSKIAKFFIAQNGFNEQNIHIIITYNYNKREMFHNKNFIDNNSNNLKYVMKNTSKMVSEINRIHKKIQETKHGFVIAFSYEFY